MIGSEWHDGQLLIFVGWFQVLGGSSDPYTNALQAHAQYVDWQAGRRSDPWPHC